MDSMLEFAKKQGFSTALLLFIAWLLNAKIEHLEIKWQDCEAQKFQIITENNERSNQVIDRNTTALERNTEVVESILGIHPSIHQKKRLDALTARQGINRQ